MKIVHRTVVLTTTLLVTGCMGSASPAATPGAAPAATSVAAPAQADHGSNERTVELVTVSPGLWTIRTSSRLIQIQIADVAGEPHVKMRPVSFEGEYFPYKETTKLSFEIGPGTPAAKAIPVRQEGEWQVTIAPVTERGAFQAAVYMDEGEHYHRLKFEFPGTGR